MRPRGSIRCAAGALALTLALLASAPAGAGPATRDAPPSLGYCIRCHGKSGVSPNDLWPNLAGQNAAYLTAQLEAFRDGTRRGIFMTAWVAMISRSDVPELAKYYAGLPRRLGEGDSGGPARAQFAMRIDAPSAKTSARPVLRGSEPAAATQPPATDHIVPAWYFGMPVVLHGRPAYLPGSLSEAKLAALNEPTMRVYVTAPVSPSIGDAPPMWVALARGTVYLPPHQDTLSALPLSEHPILGVGYFVERGRNGTKANVRVQRQPAGAWPAAPLASAIRIGAEWVQLSNHAAIEYGLATGLLKLEYFDASDRMSASVDWDQATASGPSDAIGDPIAGRVRASFCAGCHGQDGTSVNDLWPHLTGQRSGYLVRELKAFRAGERANAIMQTFAMNLSDQDIADLAAYYSTCEARQ